MALTKAIEKGIPVVGVLKQPAYIVAIFVKNPLCILLSHPNPPVELLEMVKGYAKSLSRHPASPLPREIAMALYYAAIVVAHLRCGKRISKLKDQEIRAGLERIVAQPWMTDDLRKLFEEGLDRLRRDAEERKDHGPEQAS